MIMKLFLRSICKPPEYTGVLKNNRCTISSGLLYSSHYPRTGTVPKKQMSEREVRAKSAREIFSICIYTGKKTEWKKKKTNQLHKMLTLFLQRSWQLGRRGHLCWNSQTFLELADHLSGKRCWGHSGPNSS